MATGYLIDLYGAPLTHANTRISTLELLLHLVQHDVVRLSVEILYDCYIIVDYAADGM